MRRLLSIILSLVLLLCFVGCSQSTFAWQEQYDLGTRYLSEGNYEEAIIAFSAAIEIDPKQPEGYIGMAEAYIELGDYDKAAEAVAQGREACGDTGVFEEIMRKISVVIHDAEDALKNEDGTADQNKDDEKVSPLNDYGTMRFELRENYIDFSEMTSEQHQLIEAIGNMIVINDMDTLYETLDAIGVSPFQNETIHTMWNGYKIQLYFVLSNDYSNGDRTGDFSITLRPENGEGYYCYIHFLYGDPESDQLYGFEYSCTDERIVCPCVDWQWNGEFTRIKQDRSLWSSRQDPIPTSMEVWGTESESGSVLNNFRDGICTTTTEMVSRNEPSGESMTNTETYTQKYQNGTLVESEKFPDIGQIPNVVLEGYSLGEGGDQQIYRDMVFW